MKFDSTSTQLKRAIHALSYALSLGEEIENEDEREFFDKLLDDVGFADDEDSLVEFINNTFEDYEDYDQLQKGHFTGVWFQQMKKENGDVFLRDIIGNELNMPRPISSFADFAEQKVANEYTARQISCFFIPFNTPAEGQEFTIDETNHMPLSLEQIKSGGSHNQIALNALEFAKKIHYSLNDDKNQAV